jgi:hypothetical protein
MLILQSIKNVFQTVSETKRIYETFGLCFILFFFAFLGHAQTYHHTSLWSRVVLSKQVDKWVFSLDGAYRRQNDFRFSKTNFFQKPLLDATRLTVAYRTKDWLFSFGASRWHAYPMLGNQADLGRKPTVELRFTPGIEYFKNMGKGVFQWRTQYEYRTFPDRIMGRFRQRFQFRQPIFGVNSLVFSQEFLFGFPKNTTKRYEQNQFGVTFNHNFTNKLESEIGYRHIFRRRRTSNEIDIENALVMGLLLRL